MTRLRARSRTPGWRICFTRAPRSTRSISSSPRTTLCSSSRAHSAAATSRIHSRVTARKRRRRCASSRSSRSGCAKTCDTEAMPEGDALHRAARRLQVLVGEEVEVETPHPRAAVKQLASVLDGRRLESVEAIGKNLLLRFDGGLVLRSHLRMKGRWHVVARGARRVGAPWLVLRGREREAVLWHGP